MEQGGRVEVFRLLLLCWLVVSTASAEVRHPLPVLWMMPVGSWRENFTASVTPAVRLALQDLQRQPLPLGNYEIQLQLLDSQCDPAKALKALFDAMWAGPKYLLLLGGVCPSVTALIGRSLPALSLVQVSFAALSPSLSNRKWYGNLFSTVPSDRALNQAAVKLLQRYKWRRVGIITQEEPRLSEMKKDLARQLLKAEAQLVSSESLSDDVCSSLRRLKDSDVRIIIGQFTEDSASEVFCCAYRLNMFGARYQWILADGGAAGWRLQASGCTADSLLTAADGSIRLQMRQLSSTNTPGVSGRTPQDFQDSYLRLIQEGSKVSPLHAFAYDAVWLAARALSHVMEAARQREKFSVHRNASVSKEEAHRMLLEAVKNAKFQGVTGPVFFRNGDRMTSIELIQFQGGGSVLVGEFSMSTQQLRLMNHQLKFKGPGPTRDRSLVLLEQRQVSLLLYVIISSAAAGTIVIALSVLVLTVINRKHRLLRSGVGPQDELLLLGVLLSSSSVLLSGLDGVSLSDWTFELLCSVRLWTLSLGHTVGFTVLVTRTWWLYSLRSVTQKQQSRLQLLSVLLLDVFVLTSWQILDPLRRAVLQHSPELRPATDASDDIIMRPYSEHCSSTNMELWLTALYGYKGSVLGFGCFLAWSIRTVQMDHPAVSGKHLMMSVFAVTAFSVSGVTASLLTPHNPPLHFCLSSALILCCNMVALSLMFGPKFVQVYMKGSRLRGGAAELRGGAAELRVGAAELQGGAGELQGGAGELRGGAAELRGGAGELRGGAAELRGGAAELSRLNQQLRSQTAQLDVEIETITMQLSEEVEESGAHEPKLQSRTTEKINAGEVRPGTWTHLVQVCSEDRSSETKALTPDSLNSPEHMRRRLSVQLPILHHSYLPAIGGVSTSSSSLFDSCEAFVHHNLLATR